MTEQLAEPCRRRLARRRRRCAEIFAVLEGGGEEARVVGGAVRNALMGLAGRRRRLRHDGDARQGDGARRGRRHQGGADRHRARHGDAGRRRARLRGDDAARGHRDRRTPRRRALRPRLGGRRAPARLHGQRAFGRFRPARSTIPVGGYADIRRPPHPLHRRRRPAHRRGSPAHPSPLPLPRRVRRGRASTPPACRRRSAPATGFAISRPSGSARRCGGSSSRRAPPRRSR